MNTPKADELQSSMSADRQYKQNSTELIEREEIKGTPFTIIKANNKYFLTMGIIRLTEDMDTAEEVKTTIETEIYNIIVRMIGGMTQLNNQFQETQWNDIIKRFLKTHTVTPNHD